MTELETIQHAKNYIDKLAQGINPLTNQPVPEEELINNVHISRCFFFVSDVLRRVLENGGVSTKSRPKLAAFQIDHETLTHFAYSGEPLAISRITERINELVDTTQTKKLSYNVIQNWLLEIGLLEEIELPDGKKKKRPSEQGRQVGISLEHRVNPYGKEYNVILYDRDAQQFIVDNLPELLEKQE